jgi:DNA-binding transcriptional ArsR family regulator
MSDDRWIVVRNWEKFQHYTNRNPPWIKLYTSLDADDEWRQLTFAERGLLVSVWIEYARTRGRLSVSMLTKLSGMRTYSAHLKALRDAGFITIRASKPLALEELEKKKKELGANAPKPKPFEARQNATPKDPAKAIRTMIENGVITDLVDLEAELLGARLNSNVGDDLRKLLQ